MMNNNLALKLVEGTKADRDQYINSVEVLDKVKKLVMLPDNKHISTAQLVNFYETNRPTIDSILNRNKDELLEDGIKILRGEELKLYKSTHLQSASEYKRVPSLTLFPKKAILRIGMLLEKSPIAKKVRDYLLKLEEISSKEQKQKALKYTGEWNTELDNYIFDEVQESVLDGNTVTVSLRNVANKINAPISKVHTRWYSGDKILKPLRERLPKDIKDKISKGFHLKSIQQTNQEVDNKILTQNVNKSIEKHFINQNTLILDLMNEIKQLKSSNEHAQKSLSKLHNDMGTLWRGYKSISESFESVTEDIQLIKKELNKYNNVIDEVYDEKINILKTRIKTQGSKIKKFKEELKNAKLVIGSYALKDDTFNYESNNQAFKMDRNGNLSRM
ncbi:hypothetical protein AB0Y20_01295 [Heyndrickxia oleronia]|uniref:hypothetical protein n=1 Tax=Heyndrickxia oleronia TaxID=38875 RepID=UPI003F276F5C